MAICRNANKKRKDFNLKRDLFQEKITGCILVKIPGADIKCHA